MTIIAGKHFALITFLVFSCVVVYQILQARKTDKPISIRRLAGVEALEEVIGRATEAGRPVHFTAGVNSIEGGDSTARVLGGLEVMAWMARRAAHYNTKLIVTVCAPSTYAVSREIAKNSFAEAGKPEAFQESMVRFLSNEQFAYATSAIGIIQAEHAAGNVMIGGFGAESLLLAEAGNTAGAIQIAGDTNVYQIPFFVVACDYTLLGEEMFAAGATLSNNRDVLGSLSAQDFGKAIAVCLIVLGALATTMGSPFFTNLVKW